jgi:hypothetical protein
MIIRFADDFVCAFQHRSEAESFYRALGERLAKFGLEVAPDKTRILRFCRFDLQGSGRFDFLGFEFYWDQTRRGRRGVKRRTSRKKLRLSLATLTDWIRRNRHHRVGQLLRVLRSKFRGYWNYYGVIGNYASLSYFFYRGTRIVFKWLNRRSQRRSYTWTGFRAVLEFFGVEGPRITEQRCPAQ